MERLAFSCGLPTTEAEQDAGRMSSPGPSRQVRREGAGDAKVSQRDLFAYGALLAFTFVLFVRPQDTIPFLRPLHLADLTASFALIALALGRMGRGAAASSVTRELVLVLGLAAVMLATAPFSMWPGGAVAVFTDVFVKVILVFALMVNTLTTPARLERFVNIVVIGTSYIAVRAVVDYVRGVNLVEGDRATGAVGGLFGNPNDMALNMVSFLPLAIVLVLGRSSLPLRAVAALGVPAIAAAIVFSKSRGGLVGLVAMLLVLLYQLGRLRPRVAALVVVTSLAAVPLLPSSFVDRMSSIVNADEDRTGSREARKNLLREGYQTFLDNPIFGVGAGQFQNYRPEERVEAWRETHNAVLQVASELGVGGVVIFTAVIVSGFAAAGRARRALRGADRSRRARRPFDSPPATERSLRARPGAEPDIQEAEARRDLLKLYAAAMTASLTGWLVAAMFASVAYYWTFYIVLGLAVAVREIAVRHAAAPVELGRKYCRARAA
jgi:O-antigen ligase